MELLELLLADGRLPVGGHTQSSGLEPALCGGLDPTDIPGLIATRLRTVVPVDAGTAVVARHAALRGAELRSVEVAWAARTPSDAARAASRQLGRGLTRLGRRLWPVVGRSLDGLTTPSRPVALGAIAAAAGLDASATARLVCYDDVQTLCAAALKLEPGDPVDGVLWLRDALPAMSDVVTRVAPLTTPDDIPAASAPLLESWVQAHPTRERRLFSA